MEMIEREADGSDSLEVYEALDWLPGVSDR